MTTSDDYEEIAPGRWVRHNRHPSSINPSPVGGDVRDGNSLKLLWAKDLEFDQELVTSIWGTFLYPGSIHLLSGEAGVGKTTFLYNLAVKACRGEEFGGILF